MWLWHIVVNLRKPPESADYSFSYLYQILWGIWKSKNNLIFKGITPNLEANLIMAKQSMAEFMNARDNPRV
jgi:hypothetical protein